MKQLLIGMGMLLSNLAWAGPEDHMYDTCYSASRSVSSLLNSNLCFEEVQLNLSSKKIEFYGYSITMPSSMRIDYLYKKNESVYFFVAKQEVVNQSETGCGSSLRIDLIVSGESNLDGQIDPKKLSVTTQIEEINNTCHSRPQNSAVEFKLTK